MIKFMTRIFAAIFWVGLSSGSAISQQADQQSPAKVEWANILIALENPDKKERQHVKVGPTLKFTVATAMTDVLLGAEFVFRPFSAAQRERLYLYDISKLSTIWPDLGKSLKEQGDVNVALFASNSQDEILGTPVKWNEAFKETMGSAFRISEPLEDGADTTYYGAYANSLMLGGMQVAYFNYYAEEDKSSRNCNGITTELLDDVDCEGYKVVSYNDAEIDFLIKQEFPREVLSVSGYIPRSQLDVNLIGFSRPITEILKLGKRKLYKGIDVSEEKTVVSSRNLDGTRLRGWQNWVVE